MKTIPILSANNKVTITEGVAICAECGNVVYANSTALCLEKRCPVQIKEIPDGHKS